MAIRKVLQRGEKGLVQKNKEVPAEQIQSPIIQQVIQDLFDTMYDCGLIAMAAPQIGESYNIFVSELRQTQARNASEADEPRVFINPKLLSSSRETSTIYEGCGSVDNKLSFGAVIRPKEITVRALDATGHVFELHCDGLLARAIQHELDHLAGLEFLDRMAPAAKKITAEYFEQHIKHAPEHEQASQNTIKEIRFSTIP
jgi:peptide deformylase